MHVLLHILEHILTVLTLGSILLYSPFAKTWNRAVFVPVAIFLVGILVNEITIAVSNEETPPVIGFALAPSVCALFAAIARATIKPLFLKVPVLKRLEETVRGYFAPRK
jgi:hypothetical protein